MYTHTHTNTHKLGYVKQLTFACREQSVVTVNIDSMPNGIKMFNLSNGLEPFQKPFVNTISKVMMGKTYETVVDRILNNAELTERVRTG